MPGCGYAVRQRGHRTGAQQIQKVGQRTTYQAVRDHLGRSAIGAAEAIGPHRADEALAAIDDGFGGAVVVQVFIDRRWRRAVVGAEAAVVAAVAADPAALERSEERRVGKEWG